MKVKMLTTFFGQDQMRYTAGEVIDVSDEVGAKLIRFKYAVKAEDEPQPDPKGDVK